VIPLLVVDAANVVGSVPDGWWRDRKGATERLREALGEVAWRGLPAQPGPMEVVLVVEGKARGVQSAPLVQVIEAPGTADDAIVELVRAREPGRPCWVVTADRALSARVSALGAQVVGPRAVR
jgi:hypothetical protein